MPYSTHLSLGLLTALACGACSLESSGTKSIGGIGGSNGEIPLPPGGGTGGTSSGGSTGATTGSATGGTQPPTPGPDASVDPDGSVDAGDPQDDLVGDYAAKRAFRTQQKVQSGALSSTVRVLTTTYAVVRITEENGAHQFYEQPCRSVSEAESDGMLKVQISVEDAVPRALGEISASLTVSASGNQRTFRRALASTALGWKPANDADKLPTMQSDARLRDADRDGNPAVTATVRSGGGVLGDSTYDAYFVQWHRTRYEGEIQSDGKLVGENFDTTEQRVVGTSTNLPNLGANNNDPVPDSNTADNRIMLVPVPSALDCDALIDQLDTIF